MCPDRQILSLYFDGELPSPWKEKMDAHLKSCEKCLSHLAQYYRLKEILEGDRSEVSAELKNRVWDKTISGTMEGLFNHTRRNPVRQVFWNRNISLTFPAAVAAAAVFIIISLLAIQGMQAPQADQEFEIAAGIGEEVQGIIPVSDMDSVLQYLSLESMSDFVVIRLPETRNFSSSGEPALLRAADYSRRSSPR